MKLVKERLANFTVVSNEYLKDKNLGLKERGLLTTLLSLPDDWEFSTMGLVAILKEGKDCITTTLQNLEKEGYLIRIRERDASGRMIGKSIYKITDDKSVFDKYESLTDKDIEPYADFQNVDNTDVENRTQLNTNIIKDKINKEISIDDIDEIYNCYPSKCVIRGASTGKTAKNKEQIKRLLKSSNTKQTLIDIINYYINDCKKNKVYMKNFSTFLNNLPDIDKKEIDKFPAAPKSSTPKYKSKFY